MILNFTKSLKYKMRFPDVTFGLTLITDCKNFKDPIGFDHYKRKLLRKMRKRETLNQITKRIDIYDKFFKNFGYECPLSKHLKRTINSGFPKYNLMVDTHFLAEMCSGILVAVTDYDCFEGDLLLDISEESEKFYAMGQLNLNTVSGEVILRDQKHIVCVLCQGADEKTKIRENTKNVLFYAYAVPGIDGNYLREGLAIAAETMSEFGKGIIQGLEIY